MLENREKHVKKLIQNLKTACKGVHRSETVDDDHDDIELMD